METKDPAQVEDDDRMLTIRMYTLKWWNQEVDDWDSRNTTFTMNQLEEIHVPCSPQLKRCL